MRLAGAQQHMKTAIPQTIVLRRLLMSIGILSIGAGCGGGGTNEPLSTDPTVNTAAPAPYDDTTIFREILAADVTAAEGGTLEITDSRSALVGVKIIIPPEALSANRTITLSEVDNPPALPAGMNYIGMPVDLGPDGLTFLHDVTIEFPYTEDELHDAGASDDTALQVWSYDKAKETWEQATVVTIDTTQNIITARVHHFSIVARTFSNATPPADVGAPQPGDLLYKTGSVIPGIKPASGWRPGHVGIYTGEKEYSGTGLATADVLQFGRYNVVEAMTVGVQYAYYDIPNASEIDETALAPFSRSDIYMGAREPLSGPLTPAQRETVVAFAEAQVGKKYAWEQTGSSVLGLLSGDRVKGPEEFNCVGLGERAYEIAGVNGESGLVSASNEAYVLTPAEQYNQTKPAGGEPPTPDIVSATITPSSGTECTLVTLRIGITHNYGLEYVAAVTYKAENGFTNPTLDINDEGVQGDTVAGDGIYSVRANAGTGVGTSSVRIDVTVTDLYGKTDTASVTYTFTGTCKKKKGTAKGTDAGIVHPLLTGPSL